MEDRLTRLVRNHERGENVTFHELGKHIFRTITAPTFSEKITASNVQAHPSEKMVRAFSYDCPAIRSYEEDLIQAQIRKPVGGDYVPRKGARNNTVFESNLDAVISQEAGLKDYIKSKRTKNNTLFASSINVYDHRKSTAKERPFSAGRKRMVTHRDRVGSGVFN
jgi:hypothetical protein